MGRGAWLEQDGRTSGGTGGGWGGGGFLRDELSRWVVHPPHMDNPSLQAQLDGICLGLVQGTVGGPGHWNGQVCISTIQIFSSWLPLPKWG